jgi:hypothetical protein
MQPAPADPQPGAPNPRNTRRPNNPNRLNAPKRKQNRGINENYARELMELHTLGVDGGYTQQDVQEVARALTGWTVMPFGPRADQLRQQMARQGSALGFVQEGSFLFRPGVHDAGEKTILGQKFPAGGGIEEGERVLDLVSHHPSTAKHLAHQIAVRFVSDTPPKPLEDRLAKVFTQSGGDMKAVIRALAYSPEFWSKDALRAKIKSPFELAASALRALDADVVNPRPTVQWIARMGQPLYAYQPPTGYPDSAKAWVNTGSLLNRMNFGLQLACGRVPGVKFDLLALNQGREPESTQAALKTYGPLLLPERDLTAMERQLIPVVNDPGFTQKVNDAAPAPESANGGDAGIADDTMATPSGFQNLLRPGARNPNRARRGGLGRNPNVNTAPPTMLAQVVGVLLGSPEFQRR